MLFTYGRMAPTLPKTTARRRIHHPSPGPHDQPVGGLGVLADPQNPVIVNVPRSVVAAPGIATIGKKSAKRARSEEHTSELQSRFDLVCRLLLEKKKKKKT